MRCLFKRRHSIAFIFLLLIFCCTQVLAQEKITRVNNASKKPVNGVPAMLSNSKENFISVTSNSSPGGGCSFALAAIVFEP